MADGGYKLLEVGLFGRRFNRLHHLPRSICRLEYRLSLATFQRGPVDTREVQEIPVAEFQCRRQERSRQHAGQHPYGRAIIDAHESVPLDVAICRGLADLNDLGGRLAIGAGEANREECRWFIQPVSSQLLCRIGRHAFGVQLSKMVNDALDRWRVAGLRGFGFDFPILLTAREFDRLAIHRPANRKDLTGFDAREIGVDVGEIILHQRLPGWLGEHKDRALIDAGKAIRRLRIRRFAERQSVLLRFAVCQLQCDFDFCVRLRQTVFRQIRFASVASDARRLQMRQRGQQRGHSRTIRGKRWRRRIDYAPNVAFFLQGESL